MSRPDGGVAATGCAGVRWGARVGLLRGSGCCVGRVAARVVRSLRGLCGRRGSCSPIADPETEMSTATSARRPGRRRALQAEHGPERPRDDRVCRAGSRRRRERRCRAEMSMSPAANGRRTWSAGATRGRPGGDRRLRHGRHPRRSCPAGSDWPRRGPAGRLRQRHGFPSVRRQASSGVIAVSGMWTSPPTLMSLEQRSPRGRFTAARSGPAPQPAHARPPAGGPPTGSPPQATPGGGHRVGVRRAQPPDARPIRGRRGAGTPPSSTGDCSRP